MISWFVDFPGRVYVLATLLPLAAFALMLGGGLVRALARPHRRAHAFASSVYYLFGGDKPLKAGAYLATGTIALTAALAITGLTLFLKDAEERDPPSEPPLTRWAERAPPWASVGALDLEAVRGRPALKLEMGYRIDHLTALMFTMVAVISTGIFIFSLGYMREEINERVVDHEVDVQVDASGITHAEHEHHSRNGVNASSHTEHLKRRGRYGRFFLYLSLFCFAMLNLLIADNLFQVFISWELVGVCSFFLIGFYYERNSASTAANKAFIVNRIGDAGFLVGLAIVWTYFGTFNFQEIEAKLRCPVADTHNDASPADMAGQILRGNRNPENADKLLIEPKGKDVLLFPEHWHAGWLHKGAVTARAPVKRDSDFTTIPYWLLCLAGAGIFLGCVGKSAQFPLHTWLPDAMEGPTPVSALIHAATMVAAGVYLVGRAYPLFTPEVLRIIAYTGAVTLFMAATIALVQNDIKRVLAYSTVSQLGYMMLALGTGGWTPGLLHLLTHAFFKALLFLAAGAVIFGLHHQQDLRKMGGLRRKMPITAYTMLIGVLAIAGTPFFSGWYSKDQIIGQAIGYGMTHKWHMLLAVLPVLTAALTAFYMFRLWLLAFAGTPRDARTYEHAHESPWIMTIPLIVLALFSLGVGWGPEIWKADGSLLGYTLQKAEPEAVKLAFIREIHVAHEHHLLAGLLALGMAVAGAGCAIYFYSTRKFHPETLRGQVAPVHPFLKRRWYFDEIYRVMFVIPIVKLAFFIGRFDKRTAKPEDAERADQRVDPTSVDGVLSAVGLMLFAFGLKLRALQSGLIRRYIVVLVLTTIMMFAILSILA